MVSIIQGDPELALYKCAQSGVLTLAGVLRRFHRPTRMDSPANQEGRKFPRLLLCSAKGRNCCLHKCFRVVLRGSLCRGSDYFRTDRWGR